jgi:arabinogalactan oligomer / maltooligosaccharide transport system substrate-binding protein
MRSAFRQGRVAMILDTASAIPGLVGGSAFPTALSVGIAPVPAGSVTSSSPLTSTAYGVYAGSSQLQQSYRLVAYLASPASQAALAERLGLLPTSAAGYARPEVEADKVVSAFEPLVRTGTGLPPVLQQPLLLPPLGDALDSALKGDASAQKVLDDTATAYTRILPGFSVAAPPG